MSNFSLKSRKGFLCLLVHLFPLRGKEFKILYKNQCLFRQEREERGALLSGDLTLYIGNNNYRGYLLERELCLHIEGTDTLHHIREELDTIRGIIGEREYIDNASSYRELPWLTDKIHPLELILKECLIECIQREMFPPLERQCIFVQLLASEYFFKKSFAIGNHHPCPLLELGEHFCS